MVSLLMGVVFSGGSDEFAPACVVVDFSVIAAPPVCFVFCASASSLKPASRAPGVGFLVGLGAPGSAAACRPEPPAFGITCPKKRGGSSPFKLRTGVSGL